MAIAMARHILVKTKEEAEDIRQRLAKGDDFAKLAKKYSICNAKHTQTLSAFTPARSDC